MIELIKRVVADMLNLQAKTQYGTITAYNPQDYTVKVLLQPEGVETGWIALTAPWSGNGLGAVFGPMPGTACRVDFAGGVAEAAIAGGRIFDANNPPPVVQAGQGAIVDKGGSYVRLNGDGTITLGASTGITSTTPLLKQVGDMEVTGTVTAPNVVATADVTVAGLSVVNHNHTDPQGGTVGPMQG
jgi:hypothetical protein